MAHLTERIGGNAMWKNIKSAVTWMSVWLTIFLGVYAMIEIFKL